MSGENWDSLAVGRVRKMVRDGAGLDEVRAVLGSKLSPGSLRDKLRREYNIRFVRPRSAHAGTSTLTFGGN